MWLAMCCCCYTIARRYLFFSRRRWRRQRHRQHIQGSCATTSLSLYFFLRPFCLTHCRPHFPSRIFACRCLAINTTKLCHGRYQTICSTILCCFFFFVEQQRELKTMQFSIFRLLFVIHTFNVLVSYVCILGMNGWHGSLTSTTIHFYFRGK